MSAFLHGQIGYLDIRKVIEHALEEIPFIASPDYNDYVETNAATRAFATSILSSI